MLFCANVGVNPIYFNSLPGAPLLGRKSPQLRTPRASRGLRPHHPVEPPAADRHQEGRPRARRWQLRRAQATRGRPRGKHIYIYMHDLYKYLDAISLGVEYVFAYSWDATTFHLGNPVYDSNSYLFKGNVFLKHV